MWYYNYGEWTEAYVFLKLLGSGIIFGADVNFEKDDNVFLNILDIIRHEGDKTLEFKRISSEELVYAIENGTQYRSIAYKELLDEASLLFESIKNVTSKDRKFSIEHTEEYLKELHFSQPKIPKLPNDISAKYGKKTDIILKTKDSTDTAVSTTGFSIKSHLGSASTLFNTAPASGLIYELVGCTDDIMNEINGNHISSVIGMIKYIKENKNTNLKFVGTSDEFQANLEFIDLRMAEVLSCMMLIQIGYYNKAKSSKVKDLVSKIEEYNPIKEVKRPQHWYKAKMKSFLYDSFAGLTATEAWDGEKKLSGGYIDVSKDGEMLFYRAVSDDVFTSFLYNHTYVDRPSRGVNKDVAFVKAKACLEGREATQTELDNAIYTVNKEGKPEKKGKYGDWGYVYKKNDGKYYMNINFQIRFQ